MNQPHSEATEWQQPPSISGGLPFTLQLLSSGAGVGIGCGVGVGFISPINLSAVPILGQASQGISAGLGPIGTWLGTAGASARQAARSLGVPGLDVGAGCGVMAGYYFGAGLMVKPSVVSQVTQATQQLAGQLTHAISQKLQRPGSTLPDSSSGTNPGVLQQQQQQHLPGSPLQPTTAHSSLPTGPAAAAAGSARAAHPAAAALFDGMIPSKQQRPADVTTAGKAAQQTDDPVVMRLLLQQQADMAALKKQNRQLRAAVCKLDPKAAVCRGWRGNGSRGKGSRRKEKDSGEGVESADGTWSE